VEGLGELPSCGALPAPHDYGFWTYEDMYLPAGTYYLWVDGATAGEEGAFALELACQTSPLFEDCWDGVDNDGDGAADCADRDCIGQEESCGGCWYTLELREDGADGWEGAALAVTLDGEPYGEFAVPVLEWGEVVYVPVFGGEQLELTYVPGSDDTENAYALYGPFYDVLFSDGPGPQPGLAWSGTASCARPPYAHAIVIDGAIDFDGREMFDTTSGDSWGLVAWDADNLYLGFYGPKVASGSANDWVVYYLSGTPGSTTGRAYGTQQPALPFESRYLIHWRADGGETAGFRNDGAGWTSAPFTLAAAQDAEYLELSVPRVEVGSPGPLELHMSVVHDLAPGEVTVAGVPLTSFVDGFDPDYGAALVFDLSGPDPPVH